MYLCLHAHVQERLQELNDMYEQVTTMERRIGTLGLRCSSQRAERWCSPLFSESLFFEEVVIPCALIFFAIVSG